MFRPTIFGKLCLLERISVGGMAEIFRARPLNEPDYSGFLVVKRILPNLAEDSEFLEMFLAEATLALSLNHANICRIYELSRFRDAHYMVMEFINGQDLLTVQRSLQSRRRVMAISQAGHIVSHVARALEYAHTFLDAEAGIDGVVHRDVSPQNILLSYDGEVKLIDFGIAKFGHNTHATQVGVLKGKFGYMSPEQVRGQTLDGRSDLFSLATVLYELITGRRLFRGESDFHTLEKVRDAEIVPPSTYNKQIPPAFDEILIRGLARKPVDRYGSCLEFASTIDAFLASEGAVFEKNRLAQWMTGQFADELDEDRRKTKFFSRFVTSDDVREFNDEKDEGLASARKNERRDSELPQEEMTQVYQSDYEGLLDDIEVENARRLDSIREVIARNPEHLLAELDLPEPNENRVDLSMFRPSILLSKRLRILSVAIVMATVGVFTVLFYTGKMASKPEQAMVRLQIEPETGIQVYLDGRLMGEQSPSVLRSVEEGVHELVIRHPHYEEYREVIHVESGLAPLIPIELVPAQPEMGSGLLWIDTEPDSIEVWMDGVNISGVSTRDGILLESHRAYRFEFMHDGHFVQEEEVVVSTGEHRILHVGLRPLQSTLVVHSQPAGEVFLDGIPQGTSQEGVVIEALDPGDSYDLEIRSLDPRYQDVQTDVVFEGVQILEKYLPLPRLGVAPVEGNGVGFIRVTGLHDWYRVLVDGRDTGLTAPFPEDEGLALEAGEREITLSRISGQQQIVVQIVEGQTTHIDCLSESWQCLP